MPRTARPPTVNADRTAALRPLILAVLHAQPRQQLWTRDDLQRATRSGSHALSAALRVLTRQGKLLQVEGGYRLPPAESSPP
jgi:hypothetical protein